MGVWTDERIQFLKDSYANRMSASRIAEELGGGITKNAVIGKAHRLGLVAAPKEPKAPRPKATKPRNSSPSLARLSAPRIPMARPQFRAEAAPLIPFELPPTDHIGVQAAVLNLRERSCRYPIGDTNDASFRFCGAHTEGSGSPYCEHHRQITYSALSPRAQAPRPQVVPQVALQVAV